jgi:hypothetical protein
MLKCLWTSPYFLNLMKIRKSESCINYDHPDKANTEQVRNFFIVVAYIID